MTITVFDDADALAHELAVRVLGAIARQPSIVLGLPTGRTPQPFYAALRAQAEARRTDWSQVRTFNLDEFVGVGADDPGSYHAYMERELFGVVEVARQHIGFLDGCAADLAAECERYERAIAAAGGIDLMVLGIGANGHIGFNEPAPGLHARTHRARLEAGTRASNADLFDGDVARVPDEGLSMGMATILRARSVVLIATGEEKTVAVEGMLRGPITTRLPASFLQLHPAAAVLLDRAARPMEA
ncbi:MAG TPA: glucosamine-6-phosphate deaminase [Vicinamibacterales bacterium]|nr:glucosamine-6-phosphate deaminase [Vicinamibacterales bacterium]